MFLGSYRDSSMFLRSNLRRAGLGYAGSIHEAEYAAAFDGDVIAGVAAHCWNGMLVLQAPAHAAAVSEFCVNSSGRRVTGFAGPSQQVSQARAGVGLEGADASLDGDEWLYALDLSRLVVPSLLSSGAVVCRPPNPAERETLCAWRLAYDVELLGASDTAEQRRRSSELLDAQIAEQNAWVAVHDDALVSLSAFNATLPDIVQLGGIYTPPALRGRGFAKAAVAASLLVARARGASRAVLFTNNQSAARTYEALGFERVGDYSLVLLR